MPTTPPPTPPDYHGSAGNSAPTPTSSSSNPNDLWGLGDLYGQPIFLGTSSRPVTTNNGQDLLPGKEISVPHFETTQEFFSYAKSLWEKQSAERKKNPGQLTGYEQLQQALWSAGFYGQTSYDGVHAGQWTSQTESALKSALGAYEHVTNKGQIPQTFTEFLQSNQAAPGGPNGPDTGPGSGGTAPTPPPQVSLTDPKEIRAAVQAAAMAALDHGLSEKQLDKFVAQFQSSQKSAELSKASSVTMPELTSEAGAFAQQTDPGAYQTHQRQSYTNALANMFLPSESARPDMTPVAPA